MFATARLQSQLGFKLEDEEEEEEDYGFDLESSFKDEAVTLQCLFQSPHSDSVLEQKYPENVAGYQTVGLEERRTMDGCRIKADSAQLAF